MAAGERTLRQPGSCELGEVDRGLCRGFHKGGVNGGKVVVNFVCCATSLVRREWVDVRSWGRRVSKRTQEKVPNCIAVTPASRGIEYRTEWNVRMCIVRFSSTKEVQESREC